MFMRREPGALRAKIGNAIFIGVLMLPIYYGIDNPYDVKDLQNMAGYGFLLTIS